MEAVKAFNAEVSNTPKVPPLVRANTSLEVTVVGAALPRRVSPSARLVLGSPRSLNFAQKSRLFLRSPTEKKKKKMRRPPRVSPTLASYSISPKGFSTEGTRLVGPSRKSRDKSHAIPSLLPPHAWKLVFDEHFYSSRSNASPRLCRANLALSRIVEQ